MTFVTIFDKLLPTIIVESDWIFFFFFWLLGLWDLSSLTGVDPESPAVEAQSLIYWTARVFPGSIFLVRLFAVLFFLD